MVFRLRERNHRDRLQDDGAPLDFDLEVSLVAQTQGFPDVGRHGHPPSRVHRNDASHARVSLHDTSPESQRGDQST